jgi:hypothetical protein
MKFNNETLIVSGYKKLSIWKLFFAKKWKMDKVNNIIKLNK